MRPTFSMRGFVCDGPDCSIRGRRQRWARSCSPNAAASFARSCRSPAADGSASAPAARASTPVSLQLPCTTDINTTYPIRQCAHSAGCHMSTHRSRQNTSASSSGSSGSSGRRNQGLLRAHGRSHCPPTASARGTSPYVCRFDSSGAPEPTTVFRHRVWVQTKKQDSKNKNETHKKQNKKTKNAKNISLPT